MIALRYLLICVGLWLVQTPTLKRVSGPQFWSISLKWLKSFNLPEMNDFFELKVTCSPVLMLEMLLHLKDNYFMDSKVIFPNINSNLKRKYYSHLSVVPSHEFCVLLLSSSLCSKHHKLQPMSHKICSSFAKSWQSCTATHWPTKRQFVTR